MFVAQCLHTTYVTVIWRIFLVCSARRNLFERIRRLDYGESYQLINDISAKAAGDFLSGSAMRNCLRGVAGQTGGIGAKWQRRKIEARVKLHVCKKWSLHLVTFSTLRQGNVYVHHSAWGQYLNWPNERGMRIVSCCFVSSSKYAKN